MSKKKHMREVPLKWVVFSVIALILLIVALWPRQVLLSGEVGERFSGQRVDLRLSVFKTELSGEPIEQIDYDNVQTTSDGRFDLIYTKSLFSLPSQSYIQLCIKTTEQMEDWSDTLPPCYETTEAAAPSRAPCDSKRGSSRGALMPDSMTQRKRCPTLQE